MDEPDVAKAHRATYPVRVVGRAPNRAVFTKESIPKGAYLLFEAPPSGGYCLDIELWAVRCQFCLMRASEELKRCAACKHVRYCGAACQREHWPVHREECALIAGLLRNQTPGKDDQGSFLRDVLMLRRAFTNSALANAMSDMCWIELNPFISKTFDMMADKCHLELPSLKGQSPSAIVRMLSKFQGNSFSLMGEIMEPIGHAVYHFTSLLNHSCVPNCAVVQQLSPEHPPVQHLIALRDIPPGEELTHSYVDQLQPRAIRQEQLSIRYGFQCKCARCAAPPPVDRNYDLIPPEMLGNAGLAELEAILQGKPHWILRCKQNERFDRAMREHDHATAVELLRKLLDYDRLIIPESHPGFQLRQRVYEYLRDKVQEEQHAAAH